MRVDIVAYDDREAISGPASWASRIPARLRQRGFDVRVLLFGWGCGQSGLLAAGYRSDGTRFSCRDFGSTDQNTRWLLEQIGIDRPDVFICNHVVPALLVGGMLRRCGIPSVGVVRSDDRFYHAVLEKFARGRAQDKLSAIVCVSEYLASIVGGGGDCRVATICSGTPLIENRSLWCSPLRIAYVGRFVQEQKRVLETARTMVDACLAIPGTSGVMIGDGPEFSAVQSIIREAGVSIDLPGRLSPSQVLETLQQAQIILLLSEYEGLPTAVVEAMSIGVVPICSRMRSGIDELVIPQKTGFVVDDFPTEVIEVVQMLSQQSDVWERMSGNCRALVRTRFSTDSSADNWADLLRQLVLVAGEQVDVPENVSDVCSFDPRWAHEDDRSSNMSPHPRTASLLHSIRRTIADMLRR
jgi:glycosyltransferase involved in cell wall biosynthesis